MIKCLAADLHTHTDVSRHGYSTVYEMIVSAKEAGLFAIGISNHGPAHPDGAPLTHFRNLREIQNEVESVLVYRGVELNILDYQGTLDVGAETIKDRLDYTIASFHEDVITPGVETDHTSGYLAVASNPLVDIIGHSGTASFAYDYERVIPVFGLYGKVVEINEATFRVRKESVSNCERIARLCMKHKVSIIVSSDAHFCKRVGACEESLRLLNRISFPEELIVNRSKESLTAWFLEKGKRKGVTNEVLYRD